MEYDKHFTWINFGISLAHVFGKLKFKLTSLQLTDYWFTLWQQEDIDVGDHPYSFYCYWFKRLDKSGRHWVDDVAD